MNLNKEEQFVLAMISTGILQAAFKQGVISKSLFDIYASTAYSKLGTNSSILSNNYNVDPFKTIRQMDAQKKNFVKSFLLEIIQKVPSCDEAAYYFTYTLEQGGLITNL